MIFEKLMGMKVVEWLGVEVVMSSKVLNGVMIEDVDWFMLLFDKVGVCVVFCELGDCMVDWGWFGEWVVIEVCLLCGKF